MSTVNLLEYLRSRTQVDIDTYDIEVSKEIGPCVDATGNQYEVYTELSKSSRALVLKKSLALAITVHPQFATISLEELVVEIAGVKLGLEVVETVRGNVHVMVNPLYSYNTQDIVSNAQRFHRICQLVNPDFDSARLVTKIPATWEGMQAARQLKRSGIKSLATTLFSMEQSILAGEAGCVSISPFLHELKTQMVDGYEDTNPILGVCVQAQQFYKQNNLPTRVKACVNIGIDELLALAGVDALTIMPDDIKTMAKTERSEAELRSLSLFSGATKSLEHVKYPSYIDSEADYRIHFASSQGGKAQFKTAQAIEIFCGFQTQAELFVKAELKKTTTAV